METETYIIVKVNYSTTSILHTDNKFYIAFVCYGSYAPKCYKRKSIAVKNANRINNMFKSSGQQVIAINVKKYDEFKDELLLHGNNDDIIKRYAVAI